LAMMARCHGLVCTAGFESVAEAAYIGKPLMAVPLRGHIEQHLNALDAELHGIALRSETFELDRLLEARASMSSARFRNWVARSDDCFQRAVEQVAKTATGDW